MYRQDQTEDYRVVGKKSVGLKGFVPVWERARPPRLKMTKQIKNKSLEELEELISELSRADTDNDVQYNCSEVRSSRLGAEVRADERSSSSPR